MGISKLSTAIIYWKQGQQIIIHILHTHYYLTN